MNAPKELDDALYDSITVLSEEGNDLADNDCFAAAKAKFEEALALVPEPKTIWEASLWLYASIGDMCFMMGDYAGGSKQMYNAINCADGYENPFVNIRLGQAQYELGDKEKAKEYLLCAYMMEGEDIFQEEDEKYFDFIRPLLRG